MTNYIDRRVETGHMSEPSEPSCVPVNDAYRQIARPRTSLGYPNLQALDRAIRYANEQGTKANDIALFQVPLAEVHIGFRSEVDPNEVLDVTQPVVAKDCGKQRCGSACLPEQIGAKAWRESVLAD